MYTLGKENNIYTLIRLRHVEESLLSQNPWNNEMHRKVVHIMDVVEMMRKDVAALKEKVGMI